jgi:urea carboxylase
MVGPHGAPDFFTDKDINTFFSTAWEVHYNSSRTGVRLIGPKPEWARRDGGEAGLHPSNIHDNAYAIGAVDFTGDMPVILGPDGPSLGGFVCPVTVIAAERWKLGQLRPGDTITFVPVSESTAAQH